MKCRFCDGQVFVGHQVCHLDILVDDSGAFLDNMPGGAEASIYESNTPFGPFQCCGCGAVYDELKDGQKETSGPIEGWKWPGDSPEDADIKGLIVLTMIRERPCENEIWADNLFVLIEKEAFQESNSQFVSTETFVMQTLRSRVQTWLATPDGWRSNCCASRDYNWGDLINDLPSEHIQVFFTRDEAKDYDILDSVSVRVAQDELQYGYDPRLFDISRIPTWDGFVQAWKISLLKPSTTACPTVGPTAAVSSPSSMNMFCCCGKKRR